MTSQPLEFALTEPVVNATPQPLRTETEAARINFSLARSVLLAALLIGPIGAEIDREIMKAVRIETVIDILFNHVGGHRHDSLVSREKFQPRALSMIIAPHR